MFILGLQGSPRKKGNTNYLLSRFLDKMVSFGAETEKIDVVGKNIQACKGCAFCEKKGYCIIDDDDMTNELYAKLRLADVVVVASPIFFYAAPSEIKRLIDRSQTLWSRKYKLGLNDPKRKTRRGFLLSLGATKGKNLFEGITLTAKYFFDAVGASYNGSLTYRHIENPGDMEKHPSVLQDIETQAEALITPMLNRKKVMFVCPENAGNSQVAAAFAQHYAGAQLEVFSAGKMPAEKIYAPVMQVMSEAGLDLEFCYPQHIDALTQSLTPDIIITMGCEDKLIDGVEHVKWDIPNLSGKPIETVRTIRDDIEAKIKAFISQI